MKILITNIQRFSLHDGPGIRTTVFLKGCSLRCPWCCNPENIAGVVQRYIKDGAEGQYGTWYDADGLLQEILKDKAFYTGDVIPYADLLENPQWLDRLPGGVTFSGGECLLQMDRMRGLLERLKSEDIHTAAETCLFAPEGLLDIALAYIDLFYVDIKILDEVLCRTVLHGDLNLYYGNLEKLMHAHKPVVFRIPVIGGYTDSPTHWDKAVELLKKYQDRIIKVELIQEHNLGLHKYKSLIVGGNDVVAPDYQGIWDGQMEACRDKIAAGTGLWTQICKI